MAGVMNVQSLAGRCSLCEKWLYWTRRQARQQAKQHPTHKSAYRCPHNESLWHIGELHSGVVAGVYTRDEIYQPRAQKDWRAA